MSAKAGYTIARVAEIPWEDRKNVDGWPSRAGMYYDDRGNNLCMRMIHYPEGRTEPRHVHAGSHAAVVLDGEAHVDDKILGPLDIILGPSNEPLSGSSFRYHLIQKLELISWVAVVNSTSRKGEEKHILRKLIAAGPDLLRSSIVL